MFTLYTKAEMISQFALAFVRLQPDFTPTTESYTLSQLGECQNAIMEKAIMAIFKQAPLPFIGQKRQFLKYFEVILDEQINDDGEGWTMIDVFGGSGLLAHTAKRKKPLVRVMYNDFDGYAERLTHIKQQQIG